MNIKYPEFELLTSNIGWNLDECNIPGNWELHIPNLG